MDSLKLCRAFLATDHLRRFIELEYLPGSDVQSDEDLLGYARKTGGTTFHQTSTCRMGPDPMAVVDAELRDTGWRGCVWWTPPSCPPWRLGIPTHRPS